MWKFFSTKKWLLWSWIIGSAILGATYYKVQLDVQINSWFGEFYNLIQTALATPHAVTQLEFLSQTFTFAKIAGIYIFVAVLTDFVVKHWIFRWRTSMDEHFTSHWSELRHIEGASQRIQDDLFRFTKIAESLGINFVRSVMTLIAFLPLLWTLSSSITDLPWIGHVDHALVYVAIIFALLGTVGLALIGIKLPGLEYENQKVEAAYRKELVYGEDDADRATPMSLKELFSNVRVNHFRLYFHYMYFDVAKWSYLQFGVMVPYIALAPTIVAGVITLGTMQQIVRAFSKVENSFQYLVNSWSTIVEFISIYKRVRAFELQLKK